MSGLRIALALLFAIGCGGKPAPQPSQPVANTAPPPKAADECEATPKPEESIVTPEMLTIYCKHVRDMCSCKDLDLACMERRADEYHQARSDWGARNPNASGDLSEADKKFMNPLVTKMAGCIHRIRGDKD